MPERVEADPRLRTAFAPGFLHPTAEASFDGGWLQCAFHQHRDADALASDGSPHQLVVALLAA
jgi:hypothetical protein